MSSFKTLFDLLGVSPRATAKEIENVLQEHLIKAGGAYDMIPLEIRQACEILCDPSKRKLYEELLFSARQHSPILVPPAEQTILIEFCQKVGFIICSDPLNESALLVSLPTPLTAFRPVPPEAPAWILIKAAASAFHYLFQGGIFQNRTRIQKLFLAVIYCFVIYEAVNAYSKIRATLAAVDAYHTNSAQDEEEARIIREREAFSKGMRGGIEGVQSRFDSLEKGFREYSQFFLATVGAAPEAIIQGTTQPFREVQWSILRHPTVRDAWDALKRSPVSEESFASIKTELSEMSTRQVRSESKAADRRRIRQIDDWIARQNELLLHHQSDLEHIKVTLQADRFENLNPPPERTPP